MKHRIVYFYAAVACVVAIMAGLFVKAQISDSDQARKQECQVALEAAQRARDAWQRVRQEDGTLSLLNDPTNPQWQDAADRQQVDMNMARENDAIYKEKKSACQ